MKHTFYITVGTDDLRFRRFLKSSYWRKDITTKILFDGRLELWCFWVHIQVWRKSIQREPTLSISLWERNIICF